MAGRSRASLHVRPISYEAKEADIRRQFAAFGPLKDVYQPLDHYSKQPKIFCYVEYEQTEDAERAIRELNGVDFFGKPLSIEWARGERKTSDAMRTRGPPQGGGRGFDGGRGGGFRGAPDYGRRGDDYGRRGDDYGRRGDDYGRRGDDYGRRGDDYGRRGDDYGRRGDDYGRRGDDYGRRGDDYGRRGDDYGRRGDDYGRREEDRRDAPREETSGMAASGGEPHRHVEQAAPASASASASEAASASAEPAAAAAAAAASASAPAPASAEPAAGAVTAEQ